jgi:predicted transcriptional regulator
LGNRPIPLIDIVKTGHERDPKSFHLPGTAFPNRGGAIIWHNTYFEFIARQSSSGLGQEPSMATTAFTTRIDVGLKKRLEQLAARDKRSASFAANLAIQNLVEERQTTRDLVLVGSNLAKSGHSMCEEDIDSWLSNLEDTAFLAVKSS